MAAFPTKLDEQARLLGYLGSHWCKHYTGASEVGAFALARSQIEYETEHRRNDAIACVARREIPLAESHHWQCFLLRKADRTQEYLRYGEGGAFYGESGLTYGGVSPKTLTAFPLPAGFTSFPVLSDGIMGMSKCWVQGVDYIVSTDQIVFRQDPFTHGAFAQTDADSPHGECVRIWAYKPTTTANLLQMHAGYVLGLDTPVTQAAKDMINVVWDALVQGSTLYTVQGLLSAMTGSPLVASDTETVEVILPGDDYLRVVTDKQVYLYNAVASPAVSVGDHVRKGDNLCDSFRVYELQSGLPSDCNLDRVCCGVGHLGEGYLDCLTFHNQDVPLVVETLDGYTKISFSLGGWPSDVSRFFSELHSRGLAHGKTLAHLLDTRYNKVGEPQAGDLPATVNPMRFFVEQVLRHHFFIAEIQAASFGVSALGLQHLDMIRQALPPHTAMLCVLGLDAGGETITMDGPGGDNAAGYSEIASAVYTASQFSDILASSHIIESEPTPSYITGICQN